jgi:hypothetical protein
MSDDHPPSVLLVPVTGGEGLGEYARCLTLARAVLDRWPAARVRFVRDRESPAVEDPRIETLEITGSPTYNSERINRWLQFEPPDVAIFDSTGRRSQLDAAGAVGARRVLIASRPSRRRKVLLRRMLSRTEQVWLIEPDARRRRLDGWERLNLRITPNRPRIVFVEALFPVSVKPRRDVLVGELGLADRPYALFSPGGGGWLVRGRPAAEIFVDAARQVSEQSSLATIVVAGPLHVGELTVPPQVIVRRSLSPEQFADLMFLAEIVAIGGGSSVGQAIAMHKPVVATALGGSDQAERVARYAAQGLVASSDPEPGGIARAVLELHRDPSQQELMRTRQDGARMRNGLETALASLTDLIR